MVAPQGYVGSITCSGCHEAEFRAWQSSDHRLAMQVAGVDTVLGDFSDALFEYNGVQSRFFNDGDTFRVRTDGPDGELTTFDIAYTFGHYPLQQYLVEFDDGRVQSLGIAWDSRPLSEGGQRWFHLYPDQALDFDDFLHWTHFTQNWNTNCAECHSTAVRKNYDVDDDRFATTFSEISVGCEACHGPGLEHLQWAASPDTSIANAGFARQLESRISWMREPGQPVATPLGEPVLTEQGVCAACHSLRTQLVDSVTPDYFNHFDLHPVQAPNYHIDGQIREEVFVYGSFLQSKMQAAGVTCGNCHEPHGLQLLAEGNALCAQCHDPFAFDSPAHHFHADSSPGPACVDCHMPATLFMQVDARRDHRFGIPRPDLAPVLGTPDACSSCHVGELARDDLAQSFRDWYPELAGERSVAEIFAAARDGAPDALAPLMLALSGDELAPILRATALQLLASYPDPNAQRLLVRYLEAPHPLERQAALSAIQTYAPADRARLATALLDDDYLPVRRAAVEAVADTPAAETPAFQSALAEYFAAVDRNADNPSVLLQAAELHLGQGNWIAAEQLQLRARQLAPAWPLPALALADLYRATDRDFAAGELLTTTVARDPDFGAAHFALALQQIRSGNRGEALESLQRATQLEPGNPRYLYVLAVALHDSGRVGEAIGKLRDGIARHPYDRSMRLALASYLANDGQLSAARTELERMLEIWPQDDQATAMLQQI